MNKHLKNILFVILLLSVFNTAFAVMKYNDSLVEKLVAEGSAKFKKLQQENEEHIKNKEYDKLNFIVNVGAGDNLFNYQYNGNDKFVVTPSVETDLNQRLQQLYINSNNTKQCYLLLISCFDVEIKATPPDGLTIEDVFNTGKFFNENSDIQDCKWLHHNITDQIIASNSVDKTKDFYIVSLGKYRGVFHKDKPPGSYYCWFSKKNLPANQTTPTYFNETYTYLKDYLGNALKNVKGDRENIAIEAVKGFEQAYKNAPLKAQILSTFTASGLKDILQNFASADDYLTLTVAERVHILKVFTGEAMIFTETYALNVLKNTPVNQQPIILDSLKSVKNNFNDNLISLLSWRMNGENFTKYIETITLWVSQHKTSNETWKQVLQRSDRNKRCIVEFSDALSDGYGSDVYYTQDDICFKVTKNFSFPISTTTKCTDVYDKILVKFDSDFNFSDRQYKKGDLVLMPSLYAHLLFNESTNDKLKTVGNVVLNVALLTVGIGEIRTATTFYETTIALLDMGVGASDLIIQEGFASTLNQSQEGKDFLNVWNKINLIWGSTRIVSEITGLNSELKNYAQQLKDKGTLTNGEKQEIDRLLQEVDEYAGSSAVNSGSALNSLNKLHNNVASSLDNSSFFALSNKLENQGFIRFDNNQYLLQSPKTFLNETGASLYDFVLDGQYYIKYDLNDGRILLSSSTDGTYFAFVQNKTPLIILPGQNPDEAIRTFLLSQSEKIKAMVGLTGNRSVNVLGQTINPSTTKTTTFIGRMSDINNLKSQLGDFKNIDLGENVGGINILNRPDVMWSSAGYNGWIVNHNMPWIQRTVSRADDVYLASNPNDLETLLRTNFNGNNVPTITAYEIRELIKGNLKPLNVTEQKWLEVKGIIQQMEINNLFINY